MQGLFCIHIKQSEGTFFSKNNFWGFKEKEFWKSHSSKKIFQLEKTFWNHKNSRVKLLSLTSSIHTNESIQKPSSVFLVISKLMILLSYNLSSSVKMTHFSKHRFCILTIVGIQTYYKLKTNHLGARSTGIFGKKVYKLPIKTCYSPHWNGTFLLCQK